MSSSGEMVDLQEFVAKENSLAWELKGPLTWDAFDVLAADEGPQDFYVFFATDQKPIEFDDVLAPTSIDAFQAALKEKRSLRRHNIIADRRPLMDWADSKKLPILYRGNIIPFAIIRASATDLNDSFVYDSGVVRAIAPVESEDDDQLQGYEGWHAMGDNTLSGGYCLGDCSRGFPTGIWEAGARGSVSSAKIATHHTKIPENAAA